MLSSRPVPQRPCIASATATPRHPGRMPSEPTWPVTLSTGAGSPTQTALSVGHRLAAFSTRSKSSRVARSMPSSAGWSAGSGMRLCAPRCPGAAGADRDPHVPVTEGDAGQQGVAGRERHQHSSPAVADARCELDRPGGVQLLTMLRRWPGSARSGWRSRPGSSRRSRAATRAPAAGSTPAGTPASPAPAAMSSRGKHKTSGPGVEELRPFRRVRPAPSGPVPPRWSPASEATGRDAGAPASRARRRPVDAIRPGTDPFPSPTGSGVGAVRRCWFDGG